MVDLHHLQERIKCREGVASIQLQETEVVEKNVTTVHAQHSKRATRERVR